MLHLFFLFYPGPNNVMVLTSGVNHGIRNSLPHVLGINIGFPVMIICVGLGIMSLFKQWPILHQLIQIIGVLYLAYLAFKIATMPINSKLNNNAKPMSFLQAALFQWVNPKAWVMSVSAIVAFSVPEVNKMVLGSSPLIFKRSWIRSGLPIKPTWIKE